jgi:hypothetical protein
MSDGENLVKAPIRCIFSKTSFFDANRKNSSKQTKKERWSVFLFIGAIVLKKARILPKDAEQLALLEPFQLNNV